MFSAEPRSKRSNATILWNPKQKLLLLERTLLQYKRLHTYAQRNVYIWCRVAASQAPPPMVCPPPHPSPKPRLSFQQTVIRHPRNCPPKLGLAPWPTGGSGSTWNHKTGNHRGGVGKDNPQHREPQGPFPFPSSSTHRR